MQDVNHKGINNLEAAVSLALLLLVMFTGDGLLKSRPYLPAIYWQSMDPLVHGLVGTIVLSPLARSRLDLVWFFGASTMIDVDHIIMARSFHVADMLALPGRPFSHSITFGLLLAALAFAVTRKRLVFWVVAIGVASHVVRDAVTGFTPLLYPLSLDSIPYLLYIPIEIALYFFCVWLAQRRESRLIGGF